MKYKQNLSQVLNGDEVTQHVCASWVVNLNECKLMLYNSISGCVNKLLVFSLPVKFLTSLESTTKIKDQVLAPQSIYIIIDKHMLHVCSSKTKQIIDKLMNRLINIK